MDNNSAEDHSSISRPWIPPKSIIWRENHKFTIKEVRDCIIDCFKYLFGENIYDKEISVCGLNNLFICQETELDYYELREACNILKTKAVTICDENLVRRSVLRLNYFLDNCEKDNDDGDKEEKYSIVTENDIAFCRDSALRMAQSMGFGLTDSTALATVVSELARNILHYAETGKIIISFTASVKGKGIKIEAVDFGPGISNLDEILSGSYRSRSGMGLGLIGSKRLLDHFHVETSPGLGTKVVGIKYVRER
jgi:serine/threonine-protein kinase RsbT